MSSAAAALLALFVFVLVTQLLRLPAALGRIMPSFDIAEEPPPEVNGTGTSNTVSVFGAAAPTDDGGRSSSRC